MDQLVVNYNNIHSEPNTMIFNDSVKVLLTEETSNTSGLLVAKIVAMLVLSISSFSVGLLPVKLAKYVDFTTTNANKNNLLISLMLCFGGGVLLFTTFLHLQPEVRESFEKLERQHKIPNFSNGIPIAELVFCTGFFFVYFIEEIVHMLLEKRGSNEEDEVLQRSISLRRCSKAVIANNNETNVITRSSINKSTTIDEFSNGNIYNHSQANGGVIKSNEININNNYNNHNHDNVTVNVTNQEKNKQKKHDHSHVLDETMKNSFHGLLAVLALSFHAIFEGLAVGLETNRSKVWYLFAAIATHKLVIAFCVGVELVTSKTKVMLMILYLGTFAIVTPIGIGIGIALSETSEAPEEVVVATILQGMAAGTLLYVVFFEVLARERSNDHEGIWQLMAIILGFTVMFILQFMTGHEHSHSHGDEPSKSHDISHANH